MPASVPGTFPSWEGDLLGNFCSCPVTAIVFPGGPSLPWNVGTWAAAGSLELAGADPLRARGKCWQTGPEKPHMCSPC